jgi:DNA-binding HxlR family transcriptional regulator
MSVDFDKLSVLMNSETRNVFEEVCNERTIRFRELVNRLAKKIDINHITQILDKLREAEFIQRDDSSGIEDFYTYYVTADGLEAMRIVRTL